jgi:hypothetical protein
MKKAVNHPYEKFLKALNLASTNDERRWSGLTFNNTEKVFEAWEAMSSRSKAKLVSDSRWNHYPLMSYTKTSGKRFGILINEVVRRALSCQREEEVRPLTNSSNGVWAVFMLDNAHSSIRLKMAKRLRNSPDVRIRTRCAKILPVSFLRPMLNDKKYSVRNMAMTRIGVDNCYNNFLPSSLAASETGGNRWYMGWLNRQAIHLAEPEEFAVLIEQAKELDPATELHNSSMEMIVTALISRMSPEEALYFMNLRNAGNRISMELERKLKYA